MQILCLITILYFHYSWTEIQNYGKDSNVKGALFGLTVKQITTLFMYVLMGEHVMAYCFDMYRKHELKRHGRYNRFGVEYAPIESCLKFIELIVDITLATLIIIHFNTVSQKEFLDLPFLHFWIMVDVLTMTL